MPSLHTTIIVGAGPAVCEFAVPPRQFGCVCRILPVGAEAHLPYCRPPLYKAKLAGQVNSQRLRITRQATCGKVPREQQAVTTVPLKSLVSMAVAGQD